MKYILVVLIFFLTGFRLIDPDLGWHLRMGEIITKSGIPNTDPFSYTMPSYPFVDYEWLTNVIWYKTWPYLGMIGWTAIYAVLAVVAVWIAIPSFGKKYAGLICLLVWSTLLFRFGMRAQIWNWFFWVILVRVMWDEEWWKKWKWGYPILMLLWVNLHGSYPIGLLVMGIWIFFNHRKDWLVWLAGILVTLINPYGIRNWVEVVSQMQQTAFYRQTVAEWQPFYTNVELGFLMSVNMVLIYLWIFRKQWKLWIVLITGMTLWMAINSHRFVPIFMLWSGPILAGFLNDLENLSDGHIEKQRRFNFFCKILLALAVVIFVFSITRSIKGANGLSEENFYPKKATKYLKSIGVRGHLFAPYNWGGYLIWQLADQKVFVDGRMAGWKLKGLEQAFVEYNQVIADEQSWADAVKKYQIGTVLWFKHQDEQKVSLEGLIDQKIMSILKITEKDNPIKIYNQFSENLEKTGWQKIYEDNVAVIYIKP